MPCSGGTDSYQGVWDTRTPADIRRLAGRIKSVLPKDTLARCEYPTPDVRRLLKASAASNYSDQIPASKTARCKVVVPVSGDEEPLWSSVMLFSILNLFDGGNILEFWEKQTKRETLDESGLFKF